MGGNAQVQKVANKTAFALKYLRKHFLIQIWKYAVITI